MVAYALASLRQIPYHSVNLAGGIWPESFANRGLLDRSVGIVGYGMIARYVVGMLAPFHCPIKVFSPAHRPGRAGPLPHGKSRAGGTVRHLRHHFHPQRHDAGKPPSCHAGAAAEHEARRAAYQYGAGRSHRRAGAVRGAGRTAGPSAALDVYETEPLPAGHPLEKLPNVLLMPHMGGPTVDRRLAVTRSVTQDIRRFLAGAAHELRDQPQLCGENVGVLKRAARERRAAVRPQQGRNRK